MAELFQQKWDDGGEHAARGSYSQKIVEKILTDEYFSQAPPKSTGREYFSNEFLSQILRDCQSLSNDDIIATITQITVSDFDLAQ